MLNNLRGFIIFVEIYNFCRKEWRLISATSLGAICVIKNYGKSITHMRALKQALSLIKKHGISHILPWIMNWEQKQKMISKKNFLNE